MINLDFADSFKKKMGIYVIINIINFKIYIGSSDNVRRRLRDHYFDLLNGTHESRYLKNAFKKYGEENFIIDILEEVDDINTLKQREQYYLDTLLYAQEYIVSKKKDKRFRNLGYNISPYADRTTGCTHSKFTKRKLSKNTKRDWRNVEYVKKQKESRGESFGDTDRNRKLMKAVLVYNAETGIFIAEYPGINKCAKTMDINRSMIRINLYGRTKQCKGFVFKFKTEEDYPNTIAPIKYKKLNEEAIAGFQRGANMKKKAIFVYDMDHRLLYTFDCAKSASIALNINVHSISIGARKETEFRGLKFRYRQII